MAFMSSRKGSGINGSLGFHEGLWGIDLYFDVGSSASSYGLVGMQALTTQTLDEADLLLRPLVPLHAWSAVIPRLHDRIERRLILGDIRGH